MNHKICGNTDQTWEENRMIEDMLTLSVKNMGQPIHYHDLLEIDFILRGSAQITRNNRIFKVDEGEIIVLNREDIHEIKSSAEDLLYVQLQMNLERYNQYIPNIWTVLFYCSPEDNNVVEENLKAEIKSYINSIYSLMEESASHVDAQKRVIYYCIEILANLKMGFEASATSVKMSNDQAARLWKMIDYMYDNHNRKLTLHEVAQQGYLSDDYTSRLLKEQNGRSFEAFMAFIRAEISIRYLLNTDMSITSIAYECGFSAPRYYITAFKKAYDCTPAEYREKNRDNFIVEKARTSSRILFDDGVSKEEVSRILNKFGLYLDVTNIIRKDLDIDFSHDQEQTSAEIPAVHMTDYRGFIMQRAYAGMQKPYTKLDDNAFCWKEQKAWKLLLTTQGASSRTEFNIHFSGLKKGSTYVCCRETSIQVPGSLQKIISAGKISELDRDIFEHMTDTNIEYDEISMEEELYMNIELSPDSFARIVLQEIS